MLSQESLKDGLESQEKVVLQAKLLTPSQL